MIALLIVCGLVNSFILQVIPWLEDIAAVLHLILWPTFLAVLLTTIRRRSARDVCLTPTSSSGWKQHPFVAYKVGMLGMLHFEILNTQMIEL